MFIQGYCVAFLDHINVTTIMLGMQLISWLPVYMGHKYTVKTVVLKWQTLLK